MRTRVRDGLLATQVSSAATTAEKTTPWLDAHAAAWREHRTAACMNATVHHTWDPATLDKALWCLDEQRLELTALVEELATADGSVVDKAIAAAAGLGPVSSCMDATVLAGMPDPPGDDIRPKVAEIRVALARSEGLDRTGKFAEGLEIARSARQAAEQLAWPPLLADAWFNEAALLLGMKETRASEEAGMAAYASAARSHDWQSAASAATLILCVLAGLDMRLPEARTWAMHAEVAIHHAGDPLQLRESHRLNCLGHIAKSEAKAGEARALYERAMAIRERVQGSEHPRTATLIHNLGNTASDQSEYPEAKTLYERALRIRERALGPEHPETLSSLARLAHTYLLMGEYAESRALYERWRDIKTATLGPEHPELIAGLAGLGELYEATGEYAQAKEIYERALAMTEKKRGPDDVRVSYPLARVGRINAIMGQTAEAKALLTRALVIREKGLGPEQFDIAPVLLDLADAYHSTGEYEEAKALHSRGLAILEKALPSEEPDLAFPLTGLGVTLVALDDSAGALVHLERAVALRTGKKLAPSLLAASRFALARALWDAPEVAGRDRGRARALGEQARDGFAENGAGSKTAWAEADAWLAAHPG